MEGRTIVGYLMKKGYLVTPEAIEFLIKTNPKELIKHEKKIFSLDNPIIDINTISAVFTEEKNNTGIINGNKKSRFEIIINYEDKAGSNTVNEFASYFKKRYELCLETLKTHTELHDIMSISRIKSLMPNDKVSFVGVVLEKNLTKNENFILKVEDPYGTVAVLIRKDTSSKEKEELYNSAKEISVDEVIGICGAVGKDIVYCNQVIWPDIPLNREIKKAKNEEYVVFTGDLHLGSKAFLKKEFDRFISWINGKTENDEDKEIVEKIRYMFIAGDLVDGTGIYPDQEEDLDIKDIFEQYNALYNYLIQIPERIDIFICSGNHDAIRLSEPQPAIYPDFAEKIYTLKNVHMLSNPSTVKIGIDEGFSGFDILMYHGFSYPYYADSIESIRSKGGLERTDLISNYLLKRRHLAPAHGSALYMPNYGTDPLFISIIPDFFITGHVHRSTISSYRSVTCINSSCWLAQTKYQEKVGLKPQPAIAALVNLATRKVITKDFLKE